MKTKDQQLSCPKYLVNVLCFRDIFVTDIEPGILATLYTYKLTKFDKTVRSIFYHHIIDRLIKIPVSKNGYRNVILFNLSELDNLGLFCFADKPIICKTINTVMKDVQKTLPIKIYTSKLSLSHLVFLQHRNQGRFIEEMEKISNFCSEDTNLKYWFKKWQNLVDTNGLIQLKNEFSDSIRLKQLLYQ